jgi:hypothetical protein
MTSLAELPHEHPLRNTPLTTIGARYRWKHGGSWKTVLPTYKIAQLTYNTLGPAWTAHDIWEATEPQPAAR